VVAKLRGDLVPVPMSTASRICPEAVMKAAR
jgi:hypothetical protein